jgi:hypothetical protein
MLLETVLWFLGILLIGGLAVWLRQVYSATLLEHWKVVEQNAWLTAEVTALRERQAQGAGVDLAALLDRLPSGFVLGRCRDGRWFARPVDIRGLRGWPTPHEALTHLGGRVTPEDQGEDSSLFRGESQSFPRGAAND